MTLCREMLKRGRLYWHWDPPSVSRSDTTSTSASVMGEAEVVRTPEQFEKLLASTREAVERGYSRPQTQSTSASTATLPSRRVASSERKPE